MKQLIITLLSLLLVGCSLQDQIAYNTNQCDEFYPYYNCSLIGAYSYTPRNYNKHIVRNSTPYCSPYYPNTQTVYYVPVQDWTPPPVDNRPTLSNTPRPERLGTYRGRAEKKQNNNTRSTRN